MSFINFPTPTPVFPQLPPEAWSVHKEPNFQKTLTEVSVSGREYQINRQVVPRFTFTLSFGGEAWLRDQTQNINPYNPLSGYTELEQLAGLFLACLGSYGEFYYTDPDDNSRLAQSVAVGDGVTDTFTLFFTWGTGPFSPPAFYPVTGISSLDAVYFDTGGGPVVQDPSTYSLDSSLTQIIFDSAPAIGTIITADFHFYWRCRFLNDVEEFDQWAKNLWEKKELKFISVKNEITPPFCLPSVSYEHGGAAYLHIPNIPTLPATSDTFLLAGWFMGLSAIGTYNAFFADFGNAGIILTIQVGALGNPIATFEIQGFDSSSDLIFDLIQTYGEYFIHSDFHSFAISVDTTTQTIQILVDKTLNVFTPTTTPGVWYTANPVAYFPSSDEWRVGQVSGGDAITLSDLRFGAGEGFFDLSNPTNVAKLFSAANGPVKWGMNGQLVTGSIPAVYLHGDNASYLTNFGTGGAFTLVNTTFNPTSPLLCNGHRPAPPSWGPPPSQDSGVSDAASASGSVSSLSSSGLMTTSVADTVIIMGIVCVDGTGSPPTVSGVVGGGLTWEPLGIATAGPAANLNFELWWADAAAILTSQSFTVTFTTPAKAAVFCAQAIRNCNFFVLPPNVGTTLDPGVPNPLFDVQTGTTPSVTILHTRIQNNLLLFANCSVPVNAGMVPPPGFTTLTSAAADFGGGISCALLLSYKTVDALQTNLTLAQTSNGFPGAASVTVLSGIP